MYEPHKRAHVHTHADGGLAGALHEAFSDIQMHRRDGWYLVHGICSNNHLLGRRTYWHGCGERSAADNLCCWSAAHQFFAYAKCTKGAPFTQRTVPSSLRLPVHSIHGRPLELEYCPASAAICILCSGYLWRESPNSSSFLRMPRVCTLNGCAILLSAISSTAIQHI